MWSGGWCSDSHGEYPVRPHRVSSWRLHLAICLLDHRSATRQHTIRMKPHLTVLTIGVDDLARAVTFYRDGLGWPTDGIVGEEFEHGAVAFFELAGGLRLALWPRASIAHDTGIAASAPCPTGFTLGHNVRSRAQVDEAMSRANAAGATIVKPAHETFWGGYAGYFQDPDGNVWEVVWNPAWEGVA